VADLARSPIMDSRYGLLRYFERYASSIRSLIAPLTGSKATSFVMPLQ
jgi:hypothetical protein